jgi:hypothetical protein
LVGHFNPYSLADEIVGKFPQRIVDGIAEARDSDNKIGALSLSFAKLYH